MEEWIWQGEDLGASWKRQPIRAELAVLEETGARKLNLIAQSMGGLDARFAISRLGMADRIATLVTVSTPHRGSAIADWATEQPDRVRETRPQRPRTLVQNTTRRAQVQPGPVGLAHQGLIERGQGGGEAAVGPVRDQPPAGEGSQAVRRKG